MCLAIPGKVIDIDHSSTPMMGKVDFSGIQKQVCLDWVPGVNVGEYVIVHVGFAISTMDEEEAVRIFGYLKDIDALNEL